MSLNLSSSKLLTLGAVVFAGFALWQFTKKPGGLLSSQPAQQQRDTALQTFWSQADSGWNSLASGNYSLSPINSLINP